MRRVALVVMLLAGCAANPTLEQCSPLVEKLQAQIAAEAAERQRIVRAAARREDTLRKQLEAMKSIERGILEREDKLRSEMR
jgi:outer membrane murein-binding lipoprotein Lpp